SSPFFFSCSQYQIRGYRLYLSFPFFLVIPWPSLSANHEKFIHQVAITHCSIYLRLQINGYQKTPSDKKLCPDDGRTRAAGTLGQAVSCSGSCPSAPRVPLGAFLTMPVS